MARPGRKRKAGPRENFPSQNRPKRGEPQNPLATALTHKRLLSFGGMPELETQFGGMRLREELTQPLYDAGIKWRELYADYLSAIEAKSVRSGSLEPSGGGGYDPDTERGQKKAERESERSSRYLKYRKLLEDFGEGALPAVQALVVDNEYVDWNGQHKAKTGLKLLAVAFGLMRRGDLD